MISVLKHIFNFLESYDGALTLIWTIGAALIVSTLKFFQFINIKRKDAKQRDYENYHKLIKDLNQSDTPGEDIKLYRQVAIVYELRNFPRYFQVTKRILSNWPRKQDPQLVSLYKEMDDAVAYMNYNNIFRFFIDIYYKII